MKKEKYILPALLLLVVLHVVGALGFVSKNYQTLFLSLTPFHLWLSAVLLLFFHENINQQFFKNITLIGLLSFWVEVLGVNTGLIFGKYYYGNTLGLQVLNTPISIACTWLLTSYTSYFIVKSVAKSGRIRISIVTALLMTSLDALIEPVAPKLHFWYWQNDKAPLQNYLAWFTISFGLVYFFYSKVNNFKNPLAVPLFIIQILFFIVLNVFL